MADKSDSQFKIDPQNEQSHSPIEIYKKQKQKRKRISKNGEHSGKWTKSEKIKYLIALKYMINLSNKKRIKKIPNMFKIMAAFIQTRNSLQCRSHHQKLHMKFHGIRRIVEKGIKQVGISAFRLQFTQKSFILQQISKNISASEQDISHQVKQSGSDQDPKQFLAPNQARRSSDNSNVHLQDQQKLFNQDIVPSFSHQEVYWVPFMIFY